MENSILQQILDKIENVEKEVKALNAGQHKLEQGQRETQVAVNHIREDIAEIKEHAEITRNATNLLIEWADSTRHNAKIPFNDLSTVE